MAAKLPPPVALLTMVTLGVADVGKSAAFYQALGFKRRYKATGDAIAFFETGGSVLGLYPWDKLALDVTLPEHPRPLTFRGSTLAWNCRSKEEVNATMAFVIDHGATLLKHPSETDYGGYSGYFADPDGHPWEIVVAPGVELGEDQRVHLPD